MKYLSFIFLFLALPLGALAQGTDFVPLTNIPAITEVGNAITTPAGLSIFLNNIYRLCIGIAGVVAVLQIMRAGIMYMGGDSVTEKKEAKNLIALSIGGLILVLSPVVVFSIINPEILSLKISGIEDLKATVTPATPVVLPSTEQGVCSVTYVELGRSLDCSAAGTEWEQASLSCCTAALIPGDGFCCGRKPQAPEPPQTGPGFRYRIAVMEERDTFNEDVTKQFRSCVRFEAETKDSQTSCVFALDAKKISIGTSKQYEVIKECAGTEKTSHTYSNLPTCGGQ